MSDLQAAETTAKKAAPAAAKAAAAKRPAKTDRLDRSKDFGKVWSSTGHPVAAYYQGGRHYDAGGARILMAGDAEREREAAKFAEKHRLERAASLRAQAERLEKGDSDEAEIGVEEDDESHVVDGLDLRAWGVGTKQYRFAAVRDAIQSKYSMSFFNEAQARSFLADKGIISAGEAKIQRVTSKRAAK